MDPGYNEMVLLLHSREGMIFPELRNFIILLVVLNPYDKDMATRGSNHSHQAACLRLGFTRSRVRNKDSPENDLLGKCS